MFLGLDLVLYILGYLFIEYVCKLLLPYAYASLIGTCHRNRSAVNGKDEESESTHRQSWTKQIN